MTQLRRFDMIMIEEDFNSKVSDLQDFIIEKQKEL